MTVSASAPAAAAAATTSSAPTDPAVAASASATNAAAAPSIHMAAASTADTEAKAVLNAGAAVASTQRGAAANSNNSIPEQSALNPLVMIGNTLQEDSTHSTWAIEAWSGKNVELFYTVCLEVGKGSFGQVTACLLRRGPTAEKRHATYPPLEFPCQPSTGSTALTRHVVPPATASAGGLPLLDVGQDTTASLEHLSSRPLVPSTNSSLNPTLRPDTLSMHAPPPPMSPPLTATSAVSTAGVAVDAGNNATSTPTSLPGVASALAAASLSSTPSFAALQASTGLPRLVAIKKVMQDRRFKNRELQLMRMVDHPNVVALDAYFYTAEPPPTCTVYLNLVLEYVPETMYRLVRSFTISKCPMPSILVKIYAFQLLRAIGYIHSLGIAHRDIKPQNLLVDPERLILKLCDFGSSKILVQGEPNVSYICSRYYRAPELIFGAANYTKKIDVWSAGCVIAEMVLGRPIFPGDTCVDQIVKIIQVLGSPSRPDIEAMNPDVTDNKMPNVAPRSWKDVYGSRYTPELESLTRGLICYVPSQRMDALNALCDPFFHELYISTVVNSGSPTMKDTEAILSKGQNASASASAAAAAALCTHSVQSSAQENASNSSRKIDFVNKQASSENASSTSAAQYTGILRQRAANTQALASASVARINQGFRLPPLFNFSQSEVSHCPSLEVVRKKFLEAQGVSVLSAASKSKSANPAAATSSGSPKAGHRGTTGSSLHQKHP